MPEPSTGYVSLVRQNRNFKYLWYGQIVSLFGDWFNLIASASLIGSLTGSGMAVGGLFVVRMLAPFFVSPIAGVAADRYNRKYLLVLTDVVRAVVVLGFLFVRSIDLLWLLYVLTAIQLAMHGVFFPTRNAILPDIVSEKELGTANVITGTTWSVMLAMGAAAGGLVAGGWGIYPAFIIDSATFVLSAFFITRIRYRPPQRDVHDKSLRAALSDYAEGLRYLGRNLATLAIALNKAALTLGVVGAFEVMQVLIARELFVIGDGGGISLGILYAVIGVGSGLGPLAARRFTGDRARSLKIAILFAFIAMAIGTRDRLDLGELRDGASGNADPRDGRWHDLGILHPAVAPKTARARSRKGVLHRICLSDPRDGGECRGRRMDPRPHRHSDPANASYDERLDPHSCFALGHRPVPKGRKELERSRTSHDSGRANLSELAIVQGIWLPSFAISSASSRARLCLPRSPS